MSSDNPSGADNQQERPSPSGWLDAIPPDLGHYVAGFVDGEGSFNVPIRRERDQRSAVAGLAVVQRVADRPRSTNASPGGLRCGNGARPARRRLLLRDHETERPRGQGVPLLRAVSAAWSEGQRPGDPSTGHSARPVGAPSLSNRYRGNPRLEGSDEPRRKAAPQRCTNHRGVEGLGILRGHTQSSLVEAEGRRYGPHLIAIWGPCEL